MFCNQDVLIIFVKYPKPGQVKTRLAKSIGKNSAARLYRVFVEAIVKRTESKSFRRIIFYAPEAREKDMKKWLGDSLVFYPQKGRTLGQRLSGAFQFAFKNGARKIVAIGSDSPTIDKKTVGEAFRKLKGARCVLGPASDGGYYLVGLSSFSREIFKGIHWGTKSVFIRTVDKLKQLKIKYSLLAESFDIDTYSDIILLKNEMQKSYRRNSAGLERIGVVLSCLKERSG